MTRQTLIILGVLIALVSCKLNESKKIKESATKKTQKIKEKEKVEVTTVVDPYFENDSLVSTLELNLEKISQDSKFSISKKTIKNRHVDNLMDTIVTRTFKNTELISYKAESEEWVYKAKILDTDFVLIDFLKIGTKQDIVEKSLGKKVLDDTLKIKNQEEISMFSLIFESRILKSIKYDGYLD